MIEPKQILNDAEELMESAVMYLDDALARIRAGKASARILDVVKVEYYGQMSPLSNVATITTPDARTIQIQPWEKKMIAEIERAIINSSVGLAPSNNGESIRLSIPPLTEERRKELAKQCKGEAENGKPADCAVVNFKKTIHIVFLSLGIYAKKGCKMQKRKKILDRMGERMYNGGTA